MRLEYRALLNAIENEYEIDKYTILRINPSYNSKYFFPRPAKLIKYYKKNKLLLSYLLRIVLLLWPIFLFPLLLIINAIQYIFLRIVSTFKTKKQKMPLNKLLIGEKIILALSPKAVDMVQRIEKENRPIYILNYKNSELDNKLLKNFSVLSFFDNISFQIIFKSLISSLYFKYFVVLFRKNHLILQTYVSFSWFLIWFSLSKLNNYNFEFWFVNHYDRWAILIDKLEKKSRNVFLQHGKLPVDFIIPNKIKNIKTAYVFDKRSGDILRTNIIVEKCVYSQKFISTKINLSKIKVEKNLMNILIIGGPFTNEKEILLIRNIFKNFQNKVKIFLKPHPVFSNKGYKEIYKNKKNFHFIEDKKFYPKVNFAITEKSTLGIEYEMSGIPVIWMDGKTIDELIKLISSTYMKKSIQNNNY
ncbi:MAG: hypothetical protein OEZ22_05165 [Spirochaetia bacterium]|nr:hypothetical protein [Spirochaetia bacterium]